MKLVPLGVVAALLLAAAPAHAANEWQTTVDYPRKALREGREGTTYLTVTIGMDGRARNCVVTRSSGWADLDKASCKMVLKQARFRPAADDNGAPKEAPYSTHVNWRIPR